MKPTKRQVIQQIEQHLAEQLSDVAESADPADQERAAELHRQLLMYRFLPTREYGAEDVICPTALVELELADYQGVTTFCFIVPQGGGLVMQVEGRPVQVVTPNSPLGEALLGRKTGDVVDVTMGAAGKKRRYKVVSFT